jgi:hypothetical protein
MFQLSYHCTPSTIAAYKPPVESRQMPSSLYFCPLVLIVVKRVVQSLRPQTQIQQTRHTKFGFWIQIKPISFTIHSGLRLNRQDTKFGFRFNYEPTSSTIHSELSLGYKQIQNYVTKFKLQPHPCTTCTGPGGVCPSTLCLISPTRWGHCA